MDGEWFKIHCDSAFVTWTGALPNNLYGVWVKLLGIVKAHGRAGRALRNACRAWLRKANVREDELADLLSQAGDNITEDENAITIHNWHYYQGDRTNADRQARHRETSKGVTPPLRNGVTPRTEQNRTEQNRTSTPLAHGEKPAVSDATSEKEGAPPEKRKAVKAKPRPGEDPDFAAFYAAYPRKVGRKGALKAWERAKDRPPLADLLAAIEAQKRCNQWTKDNRQFIPHPATWLNKGQWDDEVPEAVVDSTIEDEESKAFRERVRRVIQARGTEQEKDRAAS